MIITLSLILLGSIICTLKFFIETEKVLSGQSKDKPTGSQGSSQLLKASSQDGSKFIAMLFVVWILSVVFVGMSIMTLPLLVIALVLTPSLINFLIRRHIINDQVICLGASLMAIGIILSLFLILI